jgi:GNAT superfamily N-acetyltransferase
MIEVRLFSPRDADVVVQLHRRCIRKGFLSQLPKSFLENLYVHIGNNKNAAVYVAVDKDDGTPVGFIAGTASTKALYQSLVLTHGFYYSFLLLPQIVRPAVAKKILETLLYPLTRHRNGRPDGVSAAAQTQAELLAIAVDEAWRGRKIGAELVSKLEQFLSDVQCKSYKVVTFSKDAISNSFYLGCDFKIKSQFLHHGNVMNQYIKNLVQKY